MLKIFLLFLLTLPLMTWAQRVSSTIITPEKERMLYARLEVGVQLPFEIEQQVKSFIQSNKASGINPFDPKQLKLWAEFQSPSGRKILRNGFFYRDFERDMPNNTWKQKNSNHNWRIRLAPDETGKWSCKVGVCLKEGKAEYSQDIGFEVSSSTRKGPLEIQPDARYLNYKASGDPFFGIGCNIASSNLYQLSPKSNLLHLSWINQLDQSNGNFIRLELGGQSFLPDWEDPKNYAGKLAGLWELDRIFEACEAKDIYLLVFRHHVELLEGEVWDVVMWEKNGYKNAFNLTNRRAYFQNPEAIKWHQYCLRYLEARYGYSTSFTFYSYAEMDNWLKGVQKDNNSSKETEVGHFAGFFNQLKSYLRDTLGNSSIYLLNTYADLQQFEVDKKGVFPYQDAVGAHQYGNDININAGRKFGRRTNYQKLVKSYPNRPVVPAEVGLTAGGLDFVRYYCCDGQTFHKTIWATSFCGTMGCGMHWWWDIGVFDQNYQTQYKALEKFTSQFPPSQYPLSKFSQKGKVRSFYQINPQEQKAIGWMENKEQHWSYRYYEDACIKELVDNGYLEEHCTFETGVELAQKTAENKNFKDLLKSSNPKGKKPTNFTEDDFLILRGLHRSNEQTKRLHYEVRWFDTDTGEQLAITNGKVSVFGRFKSEIPETIRKKADVAFAIEPTR